MTVSCRTPGRLRALVMARKAAAENRKARLEALGEPVRLGRAIVYTEKTARHFIFYRLPSGRTNKRYGRIAECQTCGKTFFSRELRRGVFVPGCSLACGMSAGTTRRGGPKLVVLDKLFSALVRAGGACMRCGSNTSLQCAHVLSRRYMSTRFDPQNAVLLCARCHTFYTHRPLEWEEWIIARIGENTYRGLRRKALSNEKIDRLAVAVELRRLASERGIPNLYAVKNGSQGFAREATA